MTGLVATTSIADFITLKALAQAQLLANQAEMMVRVFSRLKSWLSFSQIKQTLLKAQVTYC
jgi:hypothetical protein